MDIQDIQDISMGNLSFTKFLHKQLGVCDGSLTMYRTAIICIFVEYRIKIVVGIIKKKYRSYNRLLSEMLYRHWWKQNIPASHWLTYDLCEPIYARLHSFQ